MSKVFEGSLWQDREIRFDIDDKLVKERLGEKTLAVFDPVEDTKGNNGIRGLIRITNLRVLWETKKHENLNLSIGHKTILNCQTKHVSSKLRGNIEALHILAKGKSSRFEFIFSCVAAKKGPTADNQQRDLRLVDVLNKILTSYRNSTSCRELQLRSQLFDRKKLKLLPEEKIYSEISGVWNLSAEQGNLGSFILTSVRVIWFAESNLLFNVSLPWVQIENLKIRDSKFGLALVLISSPSSSKYTLGFRIDPEERLRDVAKQVAQLYKAHSKARLKVFSKFKSLHSQSIFMKKNNKNDWGQYLIKYFQPQKTADFGVHENIVEQISETVEFDEDVEIEAVGKIDPTFIYQSFGESGKPVYDPGLGLAIEELPDGVTLQSLWDFKL